MKQQKIQAQKKKLKQKTPKITKKEDDKHEQPKQNKSMLKNGAIIKPEKVQQIKTQVTKKIEQKANKVQQNSKKDDQDNIQQESQDETETKIAMNIKSPQQIKNQVKRWKQITKKYQKKRQVQYQKFRNKLEFQKQKQYQQKKLRYQQEQQAKREQIKKKLQEIQARKSKRIQEQILYKKLSTSQQKKRYLFIQKQLQFQQKKQAAEQQIKQNIIKKKKEMILDLEQLKRHEEKFLNHLKQRFKRQNSKSPNRQGSDAGSKQDGSLLNRAHKSQFNIYINSDLNQKQKNLQKFQRRKKFQEEVKKKIPLTIDEQKMKQALIAKDKFKNPLKYNYLSNVAALSDEKIYEQLKDFQINIDRKEVGNNYMRQMHKKIPNSSRVRSQSQSNLKPLDKFQYKNYLPQVKPLLKKKIIEQKQQPTNQIEQILYRYESNSDRQSELNRKSNQYRNEVIKKIVQIQKLKPKDQYTDYLGKQKVIDELYMKSIKMKLASAQIS